MATNPRPQPSEQFPEDSNCLNGNTRINKAVATNKRGDLLSGFRLHLLSHPYRPNLLEVPEVSRSNQIFQFTDLPYDLSTAPMEFTIAVKKVKRMAKARAKKKQILNVLRGRRQPYAGSLEKWLALPPVLPLWVNLE